MTVALTPPFPRLRLWRDAPAFAGTALTLSLATLPVSLALAIDDREWLGEPVWIKPLKFLVALSVYLATLAFFARWLPGDIRADRRWRRFEAAVCFAVLAEVVWIGGAAALGTGSHFNLTSIYWHAIYGVMGLFATFLTSASLVMAVLIQRSPETGLDPAAKLSLVLGLGLTLPLTLVVAFTMAAGTGHHIGTPVTGAALPLMGWSREVGDLRAPHFLATHTLHAVPLAGWLMAGCRRPAMARAAVIGAALLWVALTLGTFAQALAGKPLI